MKRLFVTAAVLPLAYAVSAQAETKITTALTTPVATATAANGQPDSLTIDTTGSVKPTAAGAAVTLNSNHAVKNAGAIGFNNVDNATGVLVQAGRTGSVSNTGTISLVEDYTAEDTDKDGDVDGPFAKGTGRFGIRVTGAGDFTGDIRNDGGQIGVEGNNSAAISVESRLVGNLVNAGAVQVVGDNSVGVSARAGVTGDVRILGNVAVQGANASAVTLGDVGGLVQLQSTITATGYRYTDRQTDAVRAKFDADDLLQGGPAVLIAGNIGKGVLLDKPPADTSATDTDEDKDGIADASEGTAIITAYGSAAALQIGGGSDITLGVVGTGDNAFGLVNRGQVGANNPIDGLGATAIRIGQGANGGRTTVAGGINNQGGTIRAIAYGGATASAPGATALLIGRQGTVSALKNSGTIDAAVIDGLAAAVAVQDRSGTLTLVENTGTIRAVSTRKAGDTTTGSGAVGANAAIALDLSQNTTGATVRQTKATSTSTPAIVGDVRFGSGADRLELLGGTLNGAMSFGAGADTLILDGSAAAAGVLSDSDGQLAVDVRDGRLALANQNAVQVSSFNLGAKGVLGVTVDPVNNRATQLNVSGAATLASGSKVDVALTSLLKEAKSYELVRAGSLTGSASGVTLSGAPYLYAGSLRTAAATNSLMLDLRPKTAAELGLNRSSAAAYGSVFAALDQNASIQNAMLAQTDQAGFVGLYDQLLPDHSGGALMSAHAISGAISQAVGSPIARNSDAYTGVWAQEIMFHLDRERDQAQGFKSQGFGLAVGAEMLGAYNALGVSGSFVTTDYKDQGAAAGEQITMNFAEGGLYWRFQAGGLRADARAGLGYVKFDSDRKISTGDVNLSTSAKWSGWLTDLHAGAAYEARFGAFFARPELSLDYLRLNEDAYQETGGGAGVDLTVDDRQGDLFTGEALLAFGAKFGGGDGEWGPEIKLGWRAKLSGDPGSTTARFGSGNPFTLAPEDLASGGAVARLGLAGEGNSVAWSVGAGGVFDDGYTEYDVRAVVRFLF